MGADADVAIYNEKPRTAFQMFSLPALRHQGRRESSSRRAKSAKPSRAGIARASRPTIIDRRLYPSAVPTVLHDGFRQLSGRNRTPRTTRMSGRASNPVHDHDVFTLKERPSVPLEIEVFTPDVIAPLTRDEIGGLPVFLGKRQSAGRVLRGRGRGQRRVGNTRRCRPGEVAWSGDDARPDHHPRRCRNAPGCLPQRRHH